MSDNYTFRTAMLDDVSQIAEVHHNARLEAYPGLIPDQHLYDKTMEQRLEHYNNFISSGGYCQLALNAGKVIGICTAGPCEEVNTSAKGEIYALYVLQLYKGRGAGKKLLLFALEYLRQQRLVPIWVFCYKKNAMAQAFYRSQGGSYFKDRIKDFGSYIVCSECYLFK